MVAAQRLTDKLILKMTDKIDQVICSRDDLKDGGMAARFAFEFDGRLIHGFTIAFDGEIYAYANSCPHRGTELDWQPGVVFDESGLYLVCATHGALFEANSGNCVGGPCQGASLIRIAVGVVNNCVNLNVGRLLSAQSPVQSNGTPN